MPDGAAMCRPVSDVNVTYFLSAAPLATSKTTTTPLMSLNLCRRDESASLEAAEARNAVMASVASSMRLRICGVSGKAQTFKQFIAR